MTSRSNTSGKKVNRTNKSSDTPYNYRPVKVGAIKFSSASKAAIYMLKRTKLSQTEIAKRIGVSQPCVCQLARDLK